MTGSQFCPVSTALYPVLTRPVELPLPTPHSVYDTTQSLDIYPGPLSGTWDQGQDNGLLWKVQSTPHPLVFPLETEQALYLCSRLRDSGPWERHAPQSAPPSAAEDSEPRWLVTLHRSPVVIEARARECTFVPFSGSVFLPQAMPHPLTVLASTGGIPETVKLTALGHGTLASTITAILSGIDSQTRRAESEAAPVARQLT